MRILFTGASSFTGSWFVHELVAAGHEVVATLRGAMADYEGGRRRRVEALVAPAVRLVERTPFGSDEFLALVRTAGPFDVLCHHAADVTNYRSPDFDYLGAVAKNTRSIGPVLRELQARNSRAGVIATGSVFEQNEGGGDLPLRAFSPYGLSKGLSWQVLQFYCSAMRVPVGKFLISNPFGPHEEPRFTAYLIRTWKEGKTASVKTPEYVRDNIHVDLLAQAYVSFVDRAACARGDFGRMAPSGYIESQGSFAQRFACAMQPRLGCECSLEFQMQQEFGEPMIRINLDPAKGFIKTWNETAAWDAVAEFYR
jgi:nucleoside-diphosphate-sugar epimerase